MSTQNKIISLYTLLIGVWIPAYIIGEYQYATRIEGDGGVSLVSQLFIGFFIVALVFHFIKPLKPVFNKKFLLWGIYTAIGFLLLLIALRIYDDGSYLLYYPLGEIISDNYVIMLLIGVMYLCLRIYKSIEQDITANKAK